MELWCGFDEPVVLNAGSIGQPRGPRPHAVILRLSLAPDRAMATFEPVSYDIAAHVAALRGLRLSQHTIDRLCQYFRTPVEP